MQVDAYSFDLFYFIKQSNLSFAIKCERHKSNFEDILTIKYKVA